MVKQIQMLTCNISHSSARNERGELTASYKWTGRVWEITNWLKFKTLGKFWSHIPWKYRHITWISKVKLQITTCNQWTWRHRDFDWLCPKIFANTRGPVSKPLSFIDNFGSGSSLPLILCIHVRSGLIYWGGYLPCRKDYKVMVFYM